MKHMMGLTAALLASAAPVHFANAAPIDLVKAAVAAEGGADALKALAGIVVKGDAKHWEPGQSLKAGGEPRFLGDTMFTLTWNVAKNEAKLDVNRAMVYPPPAAQVKYSEVETPSGGFVTAANGSVTPASGMRVAAQLRELERSSPTLLLNALDNPNEVSAIGNQKLGKASLPAVVFNENGTKFTILFDPKTHLPAAIRTRDDDNISGDSNYDLVLGDWKALGGVKVPYSLTYNLNDVKVGQITVKEVSPDPSIAASMFTPPELGESLHEAADDRQCAVSVGAAPHRARPFPRPGHDLLSAERPAQDGGACPRRAAGDHGGQ